MIADVPESSISTAKRLSYAYGYIELGLLNEAATELELIAFEERLSASVLSAKLALYMAAEQWDMVETVAKPLASSPVSNAEVWIQWAYAVRRLRGVSEAREILLKAEPAHGKTCAILHFNLACYECLLGNLEGSRQRLRTACEMDKQCKQMALDEPDLKALWDRIETL